MPLRGILDVNRLIGPNYMDWLHNLRIVLSEEKITYVFDTIMPKKDKLILYIGETKKKQKADKSLENGKGQGRPGKAKVAKKDPDKDKGLCSHCGKKTDKGLGRILYEA
ncbi:hypothetical protein BHM03_00003432 [Ensete ventricosum]|nr:hypothetical protein BHM03_00003432 [Ensete ventricosum]